MADAICPTFATNTITLNNDVLDDKALAGQPNGYSGQNTFLGTAGSFNNAWANEYLSPTAPTFGASLVTFGTAGVQS